MFFGQHRNDVVHDFTALFDVSHFPTTEHDGDLNFIFVFQKADRLFDFEIDIVLSGFGTDTDFFGLGLVRLVFVGFLALFVFVLSKVHNTADRWAFIGCDFNEIQSLVASLIKCVFGWNDS